MHLPTTPAEKPSGQVPSQPSDRNRLIFERRVLGGESLAALALDHKVSHQRIAQITARVEGWIASHPEDRLAQRLRLRCRLRYEALYDAAMTSFAASRREEVTCKERKTSRPAPGGETNESGEEKQIVTTVNERIVRQRHGDPRLLATALKAVEKLERFAANSENLAPAAAEAPADDLETDDLETDEQDVNDQDADELDAGEQDSDELDSDEQDTRSGDAGDQEPRDQSPAGQETTVDEAEAVVGSVPTNGSDEGKPGRIALCPRGPVVLIANGGHIEHMRSVAERALPWNSIVALRGETEALGWLARPDCEAALIWLEDNLGSANRSDETPSDCELARRLAERGADCPVAIGQGKHDGETAILQTLRAAGVTVEVVRRGEEGWIRRYWLPAIERLVA